MKSWVNGPMRLGLIGMTLVLAIAALGLSLFAAREANAASQPLDIQIEAGFGGAAKEGRWFPIKMTVTNPGDDVSGELAIRTNGDGGKVVLFTKALDLPRQSTKVVWFSLPGRVYNMNNNEVIFYEKGAEKGTPVPFSRDKAFIETRAVGMDTRLVGVVARDPDTLNFLSLLSQRIGPVQLVPLDIADFPWETSMLETLDVLAFNDVAADSLKPAQVEQIAAWVEQGGHLVLGGGAGYAKTMSAFGSLSPVTVSGTTTITAVPEFEQIAGRELTLGAPFTIASASVTSGETLFSAGDRPLLVSRTQGKGSVLFVAYDLAMEPLASWPGNTAIWERALPGLSKFSQPDQMWEINNALDIFPQLVPPEYGVLILLFMIYVVLVAPGLYVLLKKMDKREWAWVAIPAIAVLTSGIIYGIGASGRNATLAQTLGIHELSGSGTANSLFASSVFVPSGGKYELAWEGKLALSPLSYNDTRQLPEGSPEMTIRSEADKTAVRFANVPFWSVRKVFSGKHQERDVGQFDYSIRVDASGVNGEITNRTNRELYEAGVMLGGMWYRIGDMKPGETKPFQTSLIMSNPGYDSRWGQLVFPMASSRDPLSRERSLLNSYSTSLWSGRGGSTGSGPYMIAFSRKNVSEFTVDGKPVESERIDLLVQPLLLEFERDGFVYVPEGIVTPRMESSSATYVGEAFNGGLDMGGGEVILLYQLPSRPTWSLTKLRLNLATQPQFKVELWNESTQSYRELSGAQVELDAAEIGGMLTPGGAVRIKATNSQPNGRFTYPTLSAEGGVKR